MDHLKHIEDQINRAPRIEYRSGDTWQELIGHGCTTVAQAERYVKRAPASFRLMVNPVPFQFKK